MSDKITQLRLWWFLLIFDDNISVVWNSSSVPLIPLVSFVIAVLEGTR